MNEEGVGKKRLLENHNEQKQNKIHNHQKDKVRAENVKKKKWKKLHVIRNVVSITRK